MHRDLLVSIIEGLIFSHPEPVGVEELVKVLKDVGVDEVQSAVDELESDYHQRSRGFQLSRVAGGYQFRTLPEIASWIREMRSVKPARLSRAALETLSIVAYNQPITRNQIEQIRGVESSGTIRSLVERELVEIVGKKEVPGRPLLYGTSRRFLEVFGLADLASLPPLPDMESLGPEADE